MPEVKIAAEARTEFGKGAARRSRREGKVPSQAADVGHVQEDIDTDVTIDAYEVGER